MHIVKSINSQRYWDYVPYVNSFANLKNLYVKYIILPGKAQDDILISHYYTYVSETSAFRMITLIALPIFGMVATVLGATVFFLYDLYMARSLLPPKQNSLLLKAISNNQTDIAIALINNDEADLYSVDENGNTALCLAALQGEVRIVEAIVNKYEDFDRNELGKALVLTLLSKEINQTETITHVARVLIRHKNTNINFLSAMGRTPLMISIDNNFMKVSNMLAQDPRIELNMQDRYGSTALMIAIKRAGNKDLLLSMIRNNKTDLNKQNNSGETILMLACIKCCKRLSVSQHKLKSTHPLLFYELLTSGQGYFSGVNFRFYSHTEFCINKHADTYQKIALKIITTRSVNFKLKNKNNHSALHYAIESKNTVVANRIFRVISITNVLIDVNVPKVLIQIINSYDEGENTKPDKISNNPPIPN